MALYLQLADGNYKRIASNSEGGSDSVVYYDKAADFPTTGELEKLYVDKATGEIFTWNSTKTEYVATGVTKAEGITYVNTDSSLSATDVQAAIDEVVANMKDMELFKFPNATIIGAPTINNGQVSGFSASNYMKFPFIVNMQGRPFTIDIAFTTGTDITNQQNIIDGIDHGIAFAIRDRKFVLVLGSKTGEWDISGGEKQSGQIVDPEKSYRVKISWDGSVYTFEYSDDGESYTEVTELRVTSSLSPYPTQINIGVTSALGGIFKGIINMNYCSLTISDKIVWTGMDDVGLATRMAVDMSNIDQAGIDKIKSIAPSYISGGDGINVNNDPSSEDYKKITNTGVISVIESPDTKEESGEDKYDNGTILVQTGIESEDNPPVPVKVKGINTAAFMPIEKEITEDSDDAIPTSKAVADFVLDNTDSNTWIGTKADYEKEKDDIETGTKVFITDDEGESVALIHSNITGRDAADSHPMSAITGLSDALDNKVNKSETSSVDNNTRIVEVPEDVDCFASVAMIGGKTVKNLFTGYLNLQSYSVSTEKYNGHQVISGTNVQWNGAIFSDFELKAGKKYRFKAMVKVSNTSAKILTVWNYAVGNGATTGVTPPAANTWFVYEEIGTCKTEENGTLPRLESNETADVSIALMTITEESENYGLLETGLNSASVESIVSQGKNPFDGKFEIGGYAWATGAKISSTDRIRNVNKIYVNPNTTYYVNRSLNVLMYDKNDNLITGSEYSTVDRSVFTTTANTDYVNIVMQGETDIKINIYFSTINGKFEPYINKTELSLADITKNLPDYGCSAGNVYNYIDFEEMKYHHRVGSVAMDSLNYTYVSSGKTRFVSTAIDDAKPVAREVTGNILISANYTVGSCAYVYDNSNSIGIGSTKQIWICDPGAGTDESNFKTVTMKGVILYYELAQEELIPLSDVLPPFHIEPNGTIEFVNEHNLDVPSKTIYKKTV